jgi:hypothetical protein
VPDDALQHATERAEELETMRASLFCRELAQATVGGALGRAFARPAARIKGVGIDVPGLNT